MRRSLWNAADQTQAATIETQMPIRVSLGGFTFEFGAHVSLPQDIDGADAEAAQHHHPTVAQASAQSLAAAIEREMARPEFLKAYREFLVAAVARA